jgi:rfaE bifunctional protein kinase chain/domain
MAPAERLLELIDRFERTSVLLLGDLVLDRFILGTPKRISREAPVIILRHEGQRDVPGGAANALANLAALGVSALPVGVVGTDESGDALLAALADRGIDTSSILQVTGYRTATKVRILGGGSSSLKHQVARFDIEDRLPVDGGWSSRLLEHIDRRLETADAAAVSDYGYGTAFGAAVARIMSRDGGAIWTCADSRYRIRELKGVSGATPNLGELERAAGRPLETDAEVAAAADELRGHLGARFVLATRGNRGMTLVQQDREPIHIPVYGTDEVADVTGAGDTVLAVLTAALAAGADPEEAARMANYGGGVVVMKLGTATVTRDELRQAVIRDCGGAAV